MTYRLADFGSYTVGGRIHRVTEGAPREISFTRNASFISDPRGHFAVEQAYVQFFVPETRRAAPPVLLVHGGGMTGSCWETTPDGRPGWLHLLLRRGYEVHVMGAVERGRAGFAPGLWDGEPVLRSMEEAWTLFRLGRADGFATLTAFPCQRFPVDAFDRFAHSFVPRWFGTSALQTRALLAALDRIGPALVICHSQGGELAFDALAQAPHLFSALLALEPSGVPDAPEALGTTPITLVTGDYLDTADFWIARNRDWTNLTGTGAAVQRIDTRDLGGGNSHMLMMDNNSEAVLDAALGTL